jgi:hypothetical protein
VHLSAENLVRARRKRTERERSLKDRRGLLSKTSRNRPRQNPVLWTRENRTGQRGNLLETGEEDVPCKCRAVPNPNTHKETITTRCETAGLLRCPRVQDPSGSTRDGKKNDLTHQRSCFAPVPPQAPDCPLRPMGQRDHLGRVSWRGPVGWTGVLTHSNTPRKTGRSCPGAQEHAVDRVRDATAVLFAEDTRKNPYQHNTLTSGHDARSVPCVGLWAR